MGFMQAMKGANNAWGTVVCSEGIGTIGPENMINNKAQRLMVTIGMNTFVFDKYEAAPGYMGSFEFVIPDEIANTVLLEKYLD